MGSCACKLVSPPPPTGAGIGAASKRLLRASLALLLALAAPLAAAEEVLVGLLADFAPFQHWPEGGEPQGYDVDLLRRLEAETGLTFSFRRFVRYVDLAAALQAGEVRIGPATAQSPARALTMRFSRAYLSVPQAFVGRREVTSVPSTPDLAGRRLAVVQGFASEAIAIERFPMAARPAYPTLGAAVDAVLRGEADFVFETLPGLRAALAARRDEHLAVLRSYGFPEGHLRFAAPVRDAALVQRLDDGLERLPHDQMLALHQRWIEPWMPKSEPRPPTRPAGVAPLVVGYFPGDRPYSVRTAGKRADGIGIALIQRVAARAGIGIERFVPLELPELLKALAAGEVDLALGLTDTRERRDRMDFVGPYRSNPLVLISRQQYSVWDLYQVAGRRLAMLEGFFGTDYIRAMHPTIEIVECPFFNACLDAVERGEADAALYGLHGVYERLIGRGSRNLQITGVVLGLYDEQNFGLARQRAAIAPALRDALEVTLREDMPRLEKEWAQRDASRVDRDRVLLVVGTALAALATLALAWWLHSRRLRREIARTRAARAEAEAARQDSERYLAFMTHEVRNSLQSVSGAVELLRRRGAGADALLAALRRSARATLGLLDGLLDRHQLEARCLSPQRQPARPRAVADEVVQDMAPAAAAKGLVLRLEIDGSGDGGGDEWLLLDALRVQQVLRNLVVNAIKFSSQGVVAVTLDVTPAASGHRRVRLAVADQGPGVAPADRQRIFEPGVSAGGDRPGSGLGLSFCRELAQAMGGTLELADAPGGGACFVLAFDAEPAPPPAVPRAVRRLLVVEDSPVYAMLLRQAFENQGLEVQVVETLAQARDLLARDPRPDLLLTDTHLSDGTPEELLRALGGRVQALCMSSGFDTGAEQRLLAAGARACLPKDADIAAFAAKVLRAVG